MAARTMDEWMARLESKSLAWLLDQRSACVRGFNGKAYDDAVDALVRARMARGEEHRASRKRPAVLRAGEEEEGEVEVIDYGGKGGKLRVVRPIE